MKLEELQAGDHHYKAYVGPPLKYDLIGAMQFNLLTAFGLRDHHKFLDIGCGSLRSGKLLIPYLQKGNYYGIEPNEWLIQEGIKNEIGNDLIRIKAPQFSHSSDFDLQDFGEKFDYMIAQSIFSHTSVDQIDKCLKEAKIVMKKQAIFLATFVIGAKNYEGNEWVYPECVQYQHQFILGRIKRHQLEAIKTNWHHPNGQTWYVIFHPENRPAIQERLGNLFTMNKSKISILKSIKKSSVFNTPLTRKLYRSFKRN